MGKFQLSETDELQHEQFAARMLERLNRLKNGSVVALRGPWGRGKTDVLARLNRHADAASGLTFAFTLTLNPWRYAHPDLLTPLVRQLLTREPSGGFHPADPGALRRAGEAVAKAGLAFGLRAAGQVFPGAALLGLAAGDFKSLLEELFTARDQQAGFIPEADPVEQMAERFRELVECALEGAPETERLLVLVDDLDRCQPSQQVAMLEAIHFLTAADARAVFVIAIDPQLLRAAMAVTYRSDRFDGDAYLEKMFDYSQELSDGLEGADVRTMISARLDEKVHLHGQDPVSAMAVLRTDWFSDIDHFSDTYDSICRSGELRTPRTISRVCSRLHLLAMSPPPAERLSLEKENGVLFALWLAATQRWPATRLAFAQLVDSLSDWRQNQPRPLVEPLQVSNRAERSPMPPAVVKTFDRWPALDPSLRELHRRFSSGPLSDSGHQWEEAARFWSWVHHQFRQSGL